MEARHGAALRREAAQRDASEIEAAGHARGREQAREAEAGLAAELGRVRAELKEKGLDTSGKKAELAARLEEARDDAERFRAATFEGDPRIEYLEARLDLEYTAAVSQAAVSQEASSPEDTP